MAASPNNPAPDFSDVGGGAGSTANPNSNAGAPAPADFSDVEATHASTAPADVTQRTYTVKSGDNLRKIAQHFYGDEMKWHAIRDANREKLPNPDRIQPGMTLVIPEG